jgi:methyl-accepting chemotaxis protein
MSSTVVVERAGVSPTDVESRRRQNWILPKLRGRMAFWLVAAPALVATTAAWAALFLLWSPVLDHVIWSMRGASPGQVFWDVCLRIFLTTGALTVIFGIVALVAVRTMSHRVAGPLDRMSEVALQVAKGRHHERVRLRDGDYIEDFAEKFNDMLDCVEARSRYHRNRMKAVQKNLSELEAALANGSVGPEELERRLSESLRIVQNARVGSVEEETPVLY